MNNFPECDNPVQQKKVEAAKKWIGQRCWKRKTANLHCSSYGFKRIMEDETEIYVTNGDFITAAKRLGYKVEQVAYPTCWFNMGIKTERNRRFWTT
jgi:hypothetical protein